MKVAVYCPSSRPTSIDGYYRNVTNWLGMRFGYSFVEFDQPQNLPEDVDLCWDPRGGRGAPHPQLARLSIPFVATFHGAAHLAMPLHECFDISVAGVKRGVRERIGTKRGWGRFDGGCLNVITVSEYAKKEFQQVLKFPQDRIRVIRHGVDHDLFITDHNEEREAKREYFLHVSSFQPKKNIKRIMTAYSRLNVRNKPELIIICPGHPECDVPEGVTLMRDLKSHSELVDYYRNSLAFIFPSLHETFGMPILEAMACGCPVVTSNVTACSEVAGDAALCVEPRSVKSLLNAMSRIASEPELRRRLSVDGQARASRFSWQECSSDHDEVFRTLTSGI